MAFDFASAGGTIGAIIALIGGAGMYLRRERTQSAAANRDIAADNAASNTYAAQATEIAAVRERLSTMETAYVAAAAQMGEMLKKISELEAKLVGVSAHHDNIILCEICLKKNERVLTALNKTLRFADENS